MDYTEIEGVPEEELSLDLHHCSPTSDALVVWIHGGGWTRGDKANTLAMAPFFETHNICFIAATYPLSAHAGRSLIDDQIAAMAGLNRWLENSVESRQFSRAFSNITLLAHSAGSHLVALADKRQGWGPNVRNLVLMDSAAFDMETRYRLAGPEGKEHLGALFDLTRYPESTWNTVVRRYSPAASRGKPPASGSRTVIVASSQKPLSVHAAQKLEASYQGVEGLRFIHYRLPWPHRYFPRAVGSHPVVNRILLELVHPPDINEEQ